MEELFNITVTCSECSYILMRIKDVVSSRVLLRVKYIQEGLALKPKRCPKHGGGLFNYEITDKSGLVFPIEYFKKEPPNKGNISTETM